MIIREYKPSDCKSLAELFYNTVHSVNIKDYTETQLNAWATGNVDLVEWNKSFSEHYTVVAVKKDIIVGFGDIDRNGYLDRLYVHKDYQHQGIATAICNELENHIDSEIITVNASITAKPFFEKRRYMTIREQKIERKGITLINYLMEKK
ncbi:GNAT family N-acetyltransferase [Porcipelethomonas sp.]|uniref:GNAT family N-acetyltransferase n=1 Tax=Porcipelethomonas sp. TaxID=2981675 RepID=UPI003EF20ED8